MKELDTHETEFLRFLGENDIKFIRLTTCDLQGRSKNLSLLPDAIPSALKNGVAIDSRRISGMEWGGALFLYPENTAFSVLPWRPSSGRVARIYCDIRKANGDYFEGDPRRILKQTVKAAKEAGYFFRFGTENEFYLFKTDEEGNPTCIPMDQGGYMDIAPLDKGENVRREICLALEEMGVNPERSCHEDGPGQNEIVFAGGDPLSAADHFLTYKMTVCTLAAHSGLAASFDPKPLPNKPGSGLHISISVLKKDEFLPGKVSADAFYQGVSGRLAELTAFLNPAPSSFRRLSALSPAERIFRVGSEKNPAVELSTPDSLVNPYLAFSLLIRAGLEGLQGKAASPRPIPENLEEALKLAEESSFISACLPAETVKAYLALCRD